MPPGWRTIELREGDYYGPTVKSPDLSKVPKGIADATPDVEKGIVVDAGYYAENFEAANQRWTDFQQGN